MSKKDYVAIAAIIKSQLDQNLKAEEVALCVVARKLASHFAIENPAYAITCRAK